MRHCQATASSPSHIRRRAPIGGEPRMVVQRMSERRPARQVIGQPYRRLRAATERTRGESKVEYGSPERPAGQGRHRIRVSRASCRDVDRWENRDASGR